MTRPEFPEFCYRDLALGSVAYRNKPMLLEDVPAGGNGVVDAFATIHRYGTDFKEHVRRTGSVSKFEGASWTDFLVFDLDGEELERVRRDTVALGYHLQEGYGVSADQLQIHFSGRRGFHVEVPIELFGALAPSAELPGLLKDLALTIAAAAGVDVDPLIYDRTRLFRLPNTKHSKSGLFKVPLTWKELTSLSAEDILELATEPREATWQPDNLEPIPALEKLVEVVAEKGSGNDGQEATGPAPTVSEKIHKKTRNRTLASVAGTLRKRGLSQAEISAALQEVNRQRCEPMLDPEEVEKIAGSISRYPSEESLGRPTYTGPPSPLTDTLQVFSRWLYLPDEDTTPVLAVLGTVAACALDGDPVWLGLVAPPSSAKTEILSSLALLEDVYPTATLTPASLLSGTPKRNKAPDARGGLLREIGEFGILVLKDFGSVLSMRAEAKAEILAALREIYDGSWTRHLGTDGGRTLHWEGKLGLVFGATPALDSHHSVIGSMGERFLLCRMEAGGQEQARRARQHSGKQTSVMRQQLSEAVAALFSDARREPRELSEDEGEELDELAYLAVRIRSTVERDRMSREVESVHGTEGPARLVLQLERLLAGLDSIGADRETAFDVVRRVAMDSVPPLRRRALEFVRKNTPCNTKTVATALGLPTNTTRRALEDLASYKLIIRESAKKTGPGGDIWRVEI